MAITNTKTTVLSKTSIKEFIKNYTILTKPRINALLLFTAYVAAIVATDGFPDPKTTLVLIFGLGLSAAGAAVINMWYDQDIDAIMGRTQERPLPQGNVASTHALVFGLLLQALSLIIFLTLANPISALLSFGGFIYYAVIYTMWLKRRTPQNIVIGGGAGAIPPLVGWAVVTGSVSLSAVLMFLIIFFWTPSHFWALALYKNEDYRRAKVPMMPVVKGARITKVQCLIYAIILAGVSMSLAFLNTLGSLYFSVTLLLNLWYIGIHIKLFFEADNQMKWAKKTFMASLIYLPVLFTLMVVCVLI
ncbi:protoheme IX farnesyltransferase [Pullulanibacillus pueri]|uniref:Protoheme IX farnesyltransferase n=1 Tax=Pullulanibacillus pueri TaxID=1437324 RepID=A0A8J2ZTN7_9BACL|nr:heme o synthase [Pullulanibacillus pueri]MBM7680311.1 protoheme IX farnesyltransferase [Pullulanibacillus pueri]GGH75717.1 protoheme IX farnesyltransferase [Pullulanibacillus pueri]